jgi:hypothetical protein
MTSATTKENSTRLLTNEPYCHNCDATIPEASALRCSRCCMVHYCSKDCQKQDFKDHQKICKQVKGVYDKMEREAVKLRNYQGGGFYFSDGTENLFETQVGKFWLIHDTRDYMRAHGYVVIIGMKFLNSQKKDNVLALNIVLNHALGMLRLCQGDNMGIRYGVPFILLRLNRDDHAYSFCRHWIMDSLGLVDNDKDDDDDEEEEEEEEDNDGRETRKPVPPEGDWPYFFESDCRFNDVYEELGVDESNVTSIGAYFLVALSIIKVRIVAALEGQQLREGKAFSDQEKLEKQKISRKRLMDLIETSNPSMLPSLLNPGPLLANGAPGFWSPGTPSEAAIVLKEALPIWDATPGGNEILIEKFGTETPSYPCSFQLEM